MIECALRYVPDDWISYAQLLATILNTSALLPQLKQNYDRQSSGDYSPITASLASAGCGIRIFTTVQLANGDPLILLNYGVALLLNMSVLLQIVYFGVVKEGKSLVQVFLADVKSDNDSAVGSSSSRENNERQLGDDDDITRVFPNDSTIQAEELTAAKDEVDRLTKTPRR